MKPIIHLLLFLGTLGFSSAADKLAQQGIIFTAAHSGSSVCTRTRSTEGPESKNDVDDVKLWKSEKAKKPSNGNGSE